VRAATSMPTPPIIEELSVGRKAPIAVIGLRSMTVLEDSFSVYAGNDIAANPNIFRFEPDMYPP
jgi:hypothetical protein